MKMKQDRGYLTIACTAIGGIVLLESIALAKGVDGIMFATAMSTIASIAVFTITKYFKQVKNKFKKWQKK